MFDALPPIIAYDHPSISPTIGYVTSNMVHLYPPSLSETDSDNKTED